MSSVKYFFTGDTLLRHDSQLVVGDEILADIASADIAGTNLEGPETALTEPVPKAGPSVKQQPGTIGQLAQAKFSYLSLANNHMMDYGEMGLGETLSTIQQARLSSSGAGHSLDEALQATHITVQGAKVALLSLAEQEFGGATEQVGGYAPLFGSQVDEAVRREAGRSDALIVYAHGGLEESPIPAEHTRRRYRELISLGAKIVVGSHPHIPQGAEHYQDGYILYSLGNFTIGFSDGRKGEWSLAAVIEMEAKKITKVQLKPIGLRQGVISYLDKSDATRCLAVINRLSTLLVGQDYQQFADCQADYLYRDRYQHFLESIFPDPAVPAHWLARLRWQPVQPKLKRYQELLLELMMVNESHRGVITQGLAGIPAASSEIHKEFAYLWAAVNDYRACRE